MRQLGAEMAPQRSAIFVLVRRATFDKVEPELARFGGRVLHTSLSTEGEARLRVALGEGTPLHSGDLAMSVSVVSLPEVRRAGGTVARGEPSSESQRSR